MHDYESVFSCEGGGEVVDMVCVLASLSCD